MLMRLKWVIVGLLSVSLLLSGCQQNLSQSPTNKQNDYIQVKNSDPVQRKKLSNTQQADHLAKLATKVPNVLSATAVVAGPYTVVGIDVDKDLDRSRVGTIKYSVVEALRKDPYGKQAVVVADADVTERLRGMASKIRQGHPIQGVVDELSAIVGRYMPEIPIQEKQPVEPDVNKKSIPNDQEKQLNNIQEDQSNHKMQQKQPNKKMQE